MTVQNGDVLRITAKLQYNGNDIQNVFHLFNYGSAENDNVVSAAIETRIDTAYSYLNVYYPDDIIYTTIAIWNVTQGVPVSENAWPTMTAGGAGTADASPLQLAPLIKFGTAIARSQGRKYLGGFVEGQQDDGGTIGAVLQVALVTWAGHFLSSVIGGAAQMAFGNWNSTLGRFASYVAYTIDNYYRTQRRRVPGVGS